MTTVQVPHAFQMPFPRPKRHAYTDERSYQQAVYEYHQTQEQRMTYDYSFRMPLLRPKRAAYVDQRVYERALSVYQEEQERRMAYARGQQPPPSSPVSDDVDVADRASLVYRLETDEDDDDDDSYVTLEAETDDDDYDDHFVFEEENPMKKCSDVCKAVSRAELFQTMPDVCCFCLDEFKRADAVTVNCQHSFCVTCYEKFRSSHARQKGTCPCCRKFVTERTTYVLCEM